MHALGCQILDGAIIARKMSIRSQTLEESEAVLPRLLHVRCGMVLQNCRSRSNASVLILRAGRACDLVRSGVNSNPSFSASSSMTCAAHVTLRGQTEATSHALRKNTPAPRKSDLQGRLGWRRTASVRGSPPRLDLELPG